MVTGRVVIWAVAVITLALLFEWTAQEAGRHMSASDVDAFVEAFHGAHQGGVAEWRANMTAVPTDDEFWGQHVLQSRPLVMRGLAFHLWPQFANASTGDVLSRLGTGIDVVHVDVADNSEFHVPDAAWRLIRPAFEEVEVGVLMDLIRQPESGTVYAVQQLSVAEHFPEFARHVPVAPFARKLQHRETNLWLCNGRKVSRLHFDGYENLLFQLQGDKNVTLYHPGQLPYLYPTEMREFQAVRRATDWTTEHLVELDTTAVNFSPVNIDAPDLATFPLFAHAQPVHVTLHPGDVLYLPAFWWHQVRSTISSGSTYNMAVNQWFEPHSALASRLFDVMLQQHLAAAGDHTSTWEVVRATWNLATHRLLGLGDAY